MMPPLELDPPPVLGVLVAVAVGDDWAVEAGELLLIQELSSDAPTV